MSNTRNFRISINLCQWFNDHRHIARIFINDDINTIGDLEKRIENIFKIKNFHLTSHNEYLPSSEDVRILQKDDVVWVMQNNYGQENTQKTTPVIVSSTENAFKSNKRMIPITEDDTEQDSHPVKKKKKKKRKLEECEDVKQSNSPEEEPKKKKKSRDNENCTTKDEVSSEQVKHKHKKIKKSANSTSNDYITSDTLEKESSTANESSSLNINKLLPVLQSHIDSYNKKISNKINETASTSNSFTTSSSTLQTDEQSELCNDSKESYRSKGTLPSYKRRVTVPTITDKYLQEKKVNIVKIEYLSGGPPHVRELELTKNNGVIDNENQSNSHTTSPKNTDSGINEPKMDSICNSGNQTDQNTPKFEHVEQPSVENRASTDDIKLIPDKCDISYSKISNSPETAEEKMEICSNETEVLQVENNSVNNVSTDKDEVIEINKSLVTNSNEILNLDKRSEVTESPGRSSPFQSLIDVFNRRNKLLYNKSKEISHTEISHTALDTKQSLLLNKSVVPPNSIDRSSKEEDISCKTTPETSKKYVGGISLSKRIDEILINMSNEILNFNKPIEVTKSVVSLNSSDLSSKEKDISCQSTPETSKNDVEEYSSSEKIINESLNNIESETENTNLNKTGVVSVCDQGINLMDNSSKTLQLPDPSDLNNSTNKTDELNKNICLISQKESTNNQNVNKSIINSSDNSKQSDIDLTEDVLDTSVLSRGNGSFRRRKQLAGIGQLLEDLRSNESLVTGESMDSDYSEFVTKRKRKRVRKRKKKNKPDTDDTSLNDSSIIATTDHIPKPIRTKACPNLHLKFAEDDGEDVKVIDVTKKETEDTESYMDTSGIENITIDSDTDQPHGESFNIKEEYILKSPSLKNMLPKVGDIIAFKILRITENYTPEVSSYIIGKVIDFNNENNIVLYEILNGLEQCKDPKGILSLEDADKNSDSNNREFAWSSIIDPRLLFP